MRIYESSNLEMIFKTAAKNGFELVLSLHLAQNRQYAIQGRESVPGTGQKMKELEGGREEERESRG